MAIMNIIQAVNSALKLEMKRDPDVILLGEDIGKFGGVFRATAGLFEEFGPDRVIDTPLAEGGIIGTAVGMALYGLRPIPEIQFSDFIWPAFDQITSEVAKYRYRSGGEYPVPMVIRTPVGGGIRGGHYHSQHPETYFAHTAGLKIACPSNPYDAKGMLISAIRDEDPVMFFEPKRIYRGFIDVNGRPQPWDMEVPEGDFQVPLGEAKVAREGNQVTLVAWGAQVHEAMAAAEIAAADGYSVEVIDLRSIIPLDLDTLIESVKKTGRFIVTHEAPRTSGFGGELIALVNEHAFLHLEAPPKRVTGWDTPFPYTLEMDYLPRAPRVVEAIKETVNF